jgi:hypothetical protein
MKLTLRIIVLLVLLKQILHENGKQNEDNDEFQKIKK